MTSSPNAGTDHTAIFMTGVLGAWLTVSVLSQITERKYNRLRGIGPLGGFIPDWRFFAPEPIRHDYAIAYRTVRTDGRESDWQRTRPAPVRHYWRNLVWNPEKREQKATTEICIELVSRASAGDASWKQHHLYKLLRDYVLRAARMGDHSEAPIIGLQFAILRYRAHDYEFDCEFLLLSPFISIFHR